MLSFEIPRIKSGSINSRQFTDEMFKELCECTPFVSGSRETIIERVFCVLNNITEHPTCPECGLNVSWTYSRSKYSTFCSSKCGANSQIIREKIKSTSFKKYGVEFVLQSNIVKDKKKITNLEKYGVECVLQSKEIRDKIKNTNVFLYGAENPFSSAIIKEKIRETNLEKYGVEYVSQSQFFQNKMKSTCFENFGVEYALQSPVIQEKFKATCLEHYGTKNPLQSQIIKDKVKATNIELYGAENPFASELIKEKIKASNIELYGVENSSQRQEIRDKKSISCAEHFCQRRNDEGTDYSGVVYILHFKELGAVKIGLTHSNNSSRFSQLRKDFGDFDIIQLLETDSCYKLESELHAEFSEHRICLESGGGRTEFFNECILDSLMPI